MDVALLRELLSRLERIWQDYLDSGPGAVDSALFADVEPTAARVTAMLQEREAPSELILAIETGVNLACRCVQRSEGLCFITGEAGLVPRRDLHEKFEGALATIRAAIEEG